ncbi:hypothetical protein P7K49_030365 [Saguinus oedipus]|uniref:Uncharacterized protein n=1 Tax=Saguinus oedipus TaxID=9490 RepID=A0ABQ9U1Y5_SAGOE|nr:hypothetical protein P7K49_030365 [Saguinus oedipus]
MAPPSSRPTAKEPRGGGQGGGEAEAPQLPPRAAFLSRACGARPRNAARPLGGLRATPASVGPNHTLAQQHPHPCFHLTHLPVPPTSRRSFSTHLAQRATLGPWLTHEQGAKSSLALQLLLSHQHSLQSVSPCSPGHPAGAIMSPPAQTPAMAPVALGITKEFALHAKLSLLDTALKAGARPSPRSQLSSGQTVPLAKEATHGCPAEDVSLGPRQAATRECSKEEPLMTLPPSLLPAHTSLAPAPL